MSSILPEKNDLYAILKKLRKSMDIFNKDINQIIEKMNKVKQNFEKLYKIYYDMVDKYDDGKRNYEIIMSLNNINNNNILKDLETINQTNNINYKVEKILEKYQQMSCYSPKTIINNNRKNKLTILNNNQQYYNSECLKHLIRFPLFKINLKFPINSLNEAYLLNRKIKVALIEFYHVKEIFNILERNKIIT